MTPTIRAWTEVLVPEEVELVDEYLADTDKIPLDTPADVYVLQLADGVAYVGISKDILRRLGEHQKSAWKTVVSPEVAVEVTDAPSEVFLAVHGKPTLAAVVATPSRRHAHLYETILTDRLGEAGVHVYGAGWDQSAPKWERNEIHGEKLDGPAALVSLVLKA